MSDNYFELKKAALEKCFSHLNAEQRRAVFKINGSLLILAGAGSGKTTVLINRIANMIRFGDAYNCPESACVYDESDISFLRSFVSGAETDIHALAERIAYRTIRPRNILAITFTNKAAGELKSRIETMLGDEGTGITACTFHSLCARILRRECEHIGFSNTFTIYDTDDSLRVIKSILRELEINDKLFPPKIMLGFISERKEMLSSPQETLSEAGDYRMQTAARIYAEYQRRLLDANAMDFDDLLCHTVRLFRQESDVLDHYQNYFKYIMVDEYQDTNTVQFLLVQLLASKYGNLCVVGDDDQSIYRFRGATIENILSFEKVFGCDPNNDVIRLEQNYRSTQNILTCANELIKNNTERKGKTLWTSAGEGKPVIVYKAADEKREAQYVADTVSDNVSGGGHFNDHAVLYRTNAQSREIELALTKSGVPYRVFGGLKFYDRKEIRDMLAYLQVINNENDMLRFRRIVNEPKRGIGDATVNTIEQIASDLGQSPVQVMIDSDALAPLVRKSSKLKPLGELFRYFEDIAETLSMPELLDEILDKTGYKAMLEAEGSEGEPRLENIEELKSSMSEYEENAEEPSLSGYLEEIALYTDMDTYNENDDYVALMTIHAAKGLEFPCVFAVGMEENLFPSQRSMESDSEVQEERRLAYVAMTRARKELHLISADGRRLYGSFQHNRRSRFVNEILNSREARDCIEQKTDSALGEDLVSFGSSTPGKGYDAVKSMGLRQQMAMRKKAETVTAEVFDFSAGDRVKHKIFGDGTILSAAPMGNDMLLEVAFDSRGTKKIMAKFSKLVKL